jgi:UDP-N-acetylenolpyruvoylglucosamine reductase
MIDLYIKAAIENNLSAEVGESLKTQLQKLERLETENDDLKDEVNDLKDQLAKHNDLSTRECDLNYRENKLKNESERIEHEQFRLDLTISEINRKNSDKRADEMYSLLGLIFKAPIIQKSIQESFSRTDPIVQSYNGGAPYPTGGVINTSGTASKTETEISK